MGLLIPGCMPSHQSLAFQQVEGLAICAIAHQHPATTALCCQLGPSTSGPPQQATSAGCVGALVEPTQCLPLQWRTPAGSFSIIVSPLDSRPVLALYSKPVLA